MNRVAVYAGTRNVYLAMAAAAKSLLHTTKVDRVVFLTEDDRFPDDLPTVIQCINVRGQRWFPETGPNYKSRWTYMSLMRLALPLILPCEERALYLDCDTICQRDIGPLFDLDLCDCHLGAVAEPGRSRRPFTYYNAGVLLMDLEKMRDGTALELIDLVNSRHLDFPDQDAINLRCQGKILTLDPVYNACPWTAQPLDARIEHFAADREYMTRPLFRGYLEMKWSEIHAR